MIRLIVSSSARFVTRLIVNTAVQNSTSPLKRSFVSLIPRYSPFVHTQGKELLNNPKLVAISNNIPVRNLIKFSYRKGKRKSIKAVRKRFYRLSWGAWIRTKCGRAKKLWKKSPPRKRRLRQHVICNATQSLLLDKMVGPYWTRRRYYVDDPYEPYHNREEFPLSAKKPKPFYPPSGSVPYC